MDESAPVHSIDCPLVAVDRRLEDAHQQWHAAEAAYFYPEQFRIAIQTAIQTLRTVTFILQNNKRVIPEFTPWYQEWQDKLRADPLMRWMVDARNRIEKQGDLEARSVVRAEIVASYLDEGPVIQVPAELSDAPLQLLKKIPNNALGDHIRKNGALRIQRRWIENTLPDQELLDAVAIAYGRLAELVWDAHRVAALKQPITTNIESGEECDQGARGGRLPCMIGHADSRSLDVGLVDGRPLKFVNKKISFDRESAERSASRYGINPIDFEWKSAGVEEIVRGLFETARKVFLKDKHHITIMFMLKQGEPVHVIKLEPENQGEKYLLMRRAAQEVVVHGIDAVVLIGEVWKAPADPMNPYMRAGEAANREEALVATIVARDDDVIQVSAKINRNGEEVTLDNNVISRGGAHFMFAPIYEAWGKPVPKEWAATIMALFPKQ